MIAIDEIVLITNGEYSSFGIISLVKALKTFDEKEVFRQFLPEQKFDEHGRPIDGKGNHIEISGAYVEWLKEKKYIEKIRYREFYTGAPDYFTKDFIAMAEKNFNIHDYGE